MPPRILLLKPQIVNIGNGFIAKGARAIIKEALPNAEIIESSAFSYYLSDVAVKNGGDESIRRNTVGIGEFVDIDAAVLPGCVLYPQPLRRHLPLFKSLEENSTPVFIIGGGGNDYKLETQNAVIALLEEGGVKGLITRDSSAYDAYANTVPDTYEGIDCAFLLMTGINHRKQTAISWLQRLIKLKSQILELMLKLFALIMHLSTYFVMCTKEMVLRAKL